MQKERSHTSRMLEPFKNVISSSIHTISLSPPTSLLRIPILFHTVKAYALIDTGAAGSFLSLQAFQNIPSCLASIISKYTSSSDGPKFKTISGEVMNATGLYQVTFQFKNFDLFTHTSHVIDGLGEGCILGIDFLTDNLTTVIPQRLL